MHTPAPDRFTHLSHRGQPNINTTRYEVVIVDLSSVFYLYVCHGAVRLCTVNFSFNRRIEHALHNIIGEPGLNSEVTNVGRSTLQRF